MADKAVEQMSQDERNRAAAQVVAETVLYMQEKGFTSAEAAAAMASLFVTGMIAARGRPGAAADLRQMASDVEAGSSVVVH